MLKNWHPYFYETPESRAGSGGDASSGTTDNTAGEVSGATGSGGYAASESAMDAMMKAAASFSSDESPDTGGQADVVARLAGQAGDTTVAGAKPAGATGQPQPGGKPTGEAPLTRIEAAVRNARTEERATVEKQYEWAKQIPENRRADIAVGFEVIDEIRRDPVAFVTQLVSEIRARGGAIDVGAPKAETPAEFTLPQGDLEGENGVRAFSTARMGEIVKGLTQHILSQVDARHKPTAEFVKGEQERREIAEMERAATSNRVTVMTEMRKQAHFTPENEARILQVAKAIPKELKDALGSPAAIIQHAYNLFVERDVLPKMQLGAEGKIRQENGKKAAASIGAAPAGSPGGTTGKPAEIKGVQGLANHMEKLAETDLAARFAS